MELVVRDREQVDAEAAPSSGLLSARQPGADRARRAWGHLRGAAVLLPCGVRRRYEGTWPQAMKTAMSATSTEVVDWMFHCVPSGA